MRFIAPILFVIELLITEKQPERGTYPLFAFHFDLASHRFYLPFHKKQSDALPFHMGMQAAFELEELVAVGLQVETYTIVADREANFAGL